MSLNDTYQSYVDLNIFTNCTKRYSDSGNLIGNTVKSLLNIFGDHHINFIRVFIDPQPCPEKLDSYIEYISKEAWLPQYGSLIDELFVTNGLADGYIKSTQVCDTDYIFQVEHDWIFLDTIKHDLGFLINCMKEQSMHHLRFNKRANIHKPWDRLTPISVLGCDFCKTSIRSNNPHIIDRQSYLNKWNSYIDLSNTPNRADGIENKMVGLDGYIYGGFQYPQQIQHVDGRN